MAFTFQPDMFKSNRAPKQALDLSEVFKAAFAPAEQQANLQQTQLSNEMNRDVTIPAKKAEFEQQKINTAIRNDLLKKSGLMPPGMGGQPQQQAMQNDVGGFQQALQRASGNEQPQQEQTQQGMGQQPAASQEQDMFDDLDEQWKNNSAIRTFIKDIFPHAQEKQTYNEVTGKMRIERTLPSGRKEYEDIDIGSKGKEEAKSYVAALDKSADDYDIALKQNRLLERMSELVNSTGAEKVPGALSEYTTKLWGSPQSKAMFGELETLGGELANIAARKFPNLNQTEYKAIQEMKPGKNDSYWALRSKIDLMRTLSEADKQYSKTYNETLQATGSKIKAIDAAEASVDMGQIKRQVKYGNLAKHLDTSSQDLIDTVDAFMEQNPDVSEKEALKLIKGGS